MMDTKIIPQQDASGNYNLEAIPVLVSKIIPQQDASGNYNSVWRAIAA